MNSPMPSPTRGSNAAVRILVVDDDEDICVSTATLLQWKGHELRTASTGDEAIRHAASFAPDLILLDISLPDMDGPEVARQIRTAEASREPVIAAVSGYSELDYKRRCAEAGFDHYLLKPVDPVALEQLLWFVDDRVAIRDTFRTLQRERVSVCLALAHSQLEFCGLLLDSAVATRDATAKARMLNKVQRMQSRLATYVANETGFSADQTGGLQSLLMGLQVRAASLQTS